MTPKTLGEAARYEHAPPPPPPLPPSPSLLPLSSLPPLGLAILFALKGDEETVSESFVESFGAIVDAKFEFCDGG